MIAGNKRVLLAASLTLALLIAAQSAVAQTSETLSEPGAASLAAGFADPPVEARPRAYWNWINGSVSLPQLTRDLEEMKDKGMGGAEMWDTGALHDPTGFVPAGPPFLGPESVAAMHHALAEAKRLGLELGLVTSSGWNAGGAWVEPRFAAKNAYVSSRVVEGPAAIAQALPFPEVPEHCPKGPGGLPLYYREITVQAIPHRADKTIRDLDEIVRLDRYFRDGVLTWDVPEGQWEILRFVCTNNGQQLIAASPKSKGPFIDFLDPEATRMHFQYILDKLGFTPESARASALAYLEVDSMELEPGIQWTEAFAQHFIDYNGYDPIPWLPALHGWTLVDADATERFRYDYAKTISDLLIFSHYTTGSAVLDPYGLLLAGEAGGPGPPIWNTCPVDALKALGNVGIPRGEFWIRHRNMFLIKEISSASHTYGKRYVDAESFTTWRRWKDSPYTMKPLVDRAFCEGLNRITYHGFAHSPEEAGLPGRTYHAGSDMNPRVTWWPKARPFMDYLARCSYMLQQGRFVADVCYFYGDQAPNFFPLFHDVPEKPRLEGLGAGYDYDVTNADVIVNRMRVEEGRIVLPDGMRYEVLLLPKQDHMPLEVLKKIAHLIEDGATVAGPRPRRVPGLRDYAKQEKRLNKLADRIWSGCDGASAHQHKYGKGRVLCGMTPDEALRLRGIAPDFACGDPAFDYIHRRVDGMDLYFVRNGTLDGREADCVFRVEGKAAAFWDPATGEASPAYECTAVPGGTQVRLRLAPGGSTFLVFGPGAPRATARIANLPAESTSAEGPAARIHAASAEGATLEVFRNGSYRVASGEGREADLTVGDVPAATPLEGPWRVRFPEGLGAPDEAVFDTLVSWTDSGDDGIKYFSGAAHYETSFTLTEESLREGQRLYLDLGDVRDVAELRLNGVPLGILWRAPFRVDITAAAAPGENRLEVEIVNTWINRLTGDQLLPIEQRYLRTNETPRPNDIGGDETWHLQPAGLLGPVRLIPSVLRAAKL